MEPHEETKLEGTGPALLHADKQASHRRGRRSGRSGRASRALPLSLSPPPIHDEYDLWTQDGVLYHVIHRDGTTYYEKQEHVGQQYRSPDTSEPLWFPDHGPPVYAPQAGFYHFPPYPIFPPPMHWMDLSSGLSYYPQQIPPNEHYWVPPPLPCHIPYQFILTGIPIIHFVTLKLKLFLGFLVMFRSILIYLSYLFLIKVTDFPLDPFITS